MAFAVFNTENIEQILLNNHNMPNKRLTNNLVRQSTTALYKLHFGVIGNGYNDDFKHVQCKKNNAKDVILGKRYRALNSSSLGVGTFSNIFKATDYNGLTVAVKIPELKYNALALREKNFLTFFASKTSVDNNYILRLLDHFVDDQERLCLVLTLCDGTLLDFLFMPKDKKSIVFAPVANRLINTASSIKSSSTNDIFHLNALVCSDKRGGENSSTQQQERQWHEGEWDALRKIATELLSALCVIRASSVIHCDIKPENCLVKLRHRSISEVQHPERSSFEHSLSRSLSAQPSHKFAHEFVRSLGDLGRLSDWHVVLADFGSALHQSEVHQTFENFDVQSLPYRAPEVLCGVPFSFAVDMWSLGVTLLELCFGRPLFTATTREELFSSITSHIGSFSKLRFCGGLYSEIISNDSPSKHDSYADRLVAIRKLCHSSARLRQVPGEALHFFAGMLSVDPDGRLTPQEALQHPFLNCATPLPTICLSSSSRGKHKSLNFASIKRVRDCRQSSPPTVPKVALHHCADSLRRGVIRQFGDFSSIPVLDSQESLISSAEARSEEGEGARTHNMKRVKVEPDVVDLTAHTDLDFSMGLSVDAKEVEAKELDAPLRVASDRPVFRTPPSTQEKVASSSRSMSRVANCLSSPSFVGDTGPQPQRYSGQQRKTAPVQNRRSNK